jgi:hypothetical protein
MLWLTCIALLPTCANGVHFDFVSLHCPLLYAESQFLGVISRFEVVDEMSFNVKDGVQAHLAWIAKTGISVPISAGTRSSLSILPKYIVVDSSRILRQRTL